MRFFRIFSFASIAPLLVAATGLSGTARAAEAPAVAVFPIDLRDTKGISRKAATKFTNLLDTIVGQQGFPTVPQAELTSQVDKAKAKSYDSCFDESCQIELGKAVAAEKILASSFASFGKTCTLTLKLLDLRRALTEFSTSEEAPCTEGGLKGAIQRAGPRLRRALPDGVEPPPQALASSAGNSGEQRSTKSKPTSKSSTSNKPTKKTRPKPSTANSVLEDLKNESNKSNIGVEVDEDTDNTIKWVVIGGGALLVVIAVVAVVASQAGGDGLSGFAATGEPTGGAAVFRF